MSTTVDFISSIEMSESDSSISLPTPILDTWIVTPSNSEERAVFQAQVNYFKNYILQEINYILFKFLGKTTIFKTSSFFCISNAWI